MIFQNKKIYKLSLLTALMINNRLVEIIESSSDWLTLRKKLKDEGIIRRPYTRKGFVRKVSKLWRKAVEDREFTEEYDGNLPGDVVRRDGVVYVIHGVVHDEGRKHFWNLNVNEDYKNAIREALEGEEVICESGFKEIFGLDDSVKEMDDFAYLGAYFFPDDKTMLLRLTLMALAGLALAPMIIPYKMLKNKLSSAVQKIKNMGTLDDLRVFREDTLKNLLPVKLYSTVSEYIGGVRGRLNYAVLSLRSMAQAKEMLDYAQERGVSELHGLVGFLHEPEIKYYLENPEKLEKLESNELYKRGRELI